MTFSIDIIKAKLSSANIDSVYPTKKNIVIGLNTYNDQLTKAFERLIDNLAMAYLATNKLNIPIRLDNKIATL